MNMHIRKQQKGKIQQASLMSSLVAKDFGDTSVDSPYVMGTARLGKTKSHKMTFNIFLTKTYLNNILAR